MKKIVPLLFVALLVVAGLSAGQEVFGPRMVVKDLRHDLGRVKQGTRVSYLFEVRNEGTDTLIIEKVQPG